MPADRVPALVKGAELVWRFQSNKKLTASVVIWQLKFDSELVSVGDAGTPEPGRASRRNGIEATLKWKLDRPWLFEVGSRDAFA